MKTWRPWTITNNTLQLTEWPDHGPGVVVVEGDVFAAFEGLVVAENGLPAWRYAAHSRQTRDIPLRPMEYSEVLADLFRHIDAHPATHYVLRTLHPERVREVWPATADSINSHHNYHRPNVTLSLGPLATQADADRLVPEMLWLQPFCSGLELYSIPTERIDYSMWLWTKGQLDTANLMGMGWKQAVTRIRVDGDRDDNVRFIEQQAINAGVGFALNWESGAADG